MKRITGAPSDSSTVVVSTDMKPPVYVPSCRRASTDFRGKYVVKLCVGLFSSHTTQKHYVFCYIGNIKHGVNSNVTLMYHMLRHHLWNPATMRAWKLVVHWDGASDNVGWPMLALLCHIVDKDWYYQVETHRQPTHHGHFYDDQKFQVIMTGWNSTFLTTNLAMALFKLIMAFKNNQEQYVLVLIQKSYDWVEYFQSSMNKNIKYYSKPLSWRITRDEEVGLPTAECKDWGEAAQTWMRTKASPKGPPIRLVVGRPGTPHTSQHAPEALSFAVLVQTRSSPMPFPMKFGLHPS